VQLNNHSPENAQRIRHHMRMGWHGLLIFGALGTLLEILHAWKNPAYLGVGNEIRRLMWTLAHAHGIGLSLLQIAYAATLAVVFNDQRPRLVRASRLLDASTLLMPLGFFLGGAVPYNSDPGIGVILVPLGALLFLAAAFFVAAELPAAPSGRAQPAAPKPEDNDNP
jgi:hypothetical protein